MLYLLDLWTDVCLLSCLPSKLYEVRICQCCVYSCWKQTGGVYSLQTTWTSGGTSWLIWCPARRAALLRGAGCRGGSCGLRAFTTFGALWPACRTSGQTGGLDADVCTLERMLTECHQIHMTPKWQKRTHEGSTWCPLWKNLTPLNQQHHPHIQHSSTEGQKTKRLQAQRGRREEGFILFYLKVLYFYGFNFRTRSSHMSLMTHRTTKQLARDPSTNQKRFYNSLNHWCFTGCTFAWVVHTWIHKKRSHLQISVRTVCFKQCNRRRL